MFIKLTHGLHSVLNAIVSYIQKWTDDSVPDGTRTLHNFKDGQGKRPAVPLDELNSSNNIVNVKTDSKFEHGTDDVTSSENVLKVELKTELGYGDDNLVSKTGIETTVCVPPPVIFEIHNEVPDKIEKVVPVKTQALPGQDFVFQILYVKDYNYIEGDILPVFGSWGNYARISRDGKYLTVNSNADLSVRLILTPAPQDWIPEKPDPSIIQNPTDRILNTIPRDGERTTYDIEEMKIEDNFYTVSIENQATTFVTNGEFSNGKYYKVDASTNKITIPMTFAEGFDENAVYWKCYDDPKSADPAQGVYPTVDYNEEFGPLPERYRKLQYIYTNDNAYMDLGIKLKTDYKCKALMNVSNRTDSSSIAIFGARNSTNTDWGYDDRFDGAYACYTRYNGYETIGYQRGTKKSYTSNHISSIYGQLCWYYSTGTSFEVQKYDGTVIRRNTVAAAQNIDTDWNCYLFTVNDKGTPYLYGVRGNMYRFEIWNENDNLLMRLIPAKNLATGSCGLYDIVNNKFYYNQRPMGYFSGPEFYVWQKPMQCSDHNATMYLENNDDIDYNADYDIPAGYQKVYEIYSKERRLDTGYKIKKDDRVECCATVDNNTNASYRVLFGSRQSSFSDDNYFFFTRFNGSNVACYGKNAKETRGTIMTYDKACKFIAEPYSLSCYNIEGNLEWKIDVDGGTPVDCRYNCWLGCGNSNGSIDSWCYAHYHYFRVYDKDDNLVVNMIPARRLSDGVLGFYDTVRNGFYTSDTGNYAYEYKNLYKGAKRILHIENINKDINLGIIRNPVYDNPFKLEDCIEDEPQNEPKDSLTYSYEITDAKILDYFYVVDHVNNATDYATLDSTYKTANVGNPASFTVTYKSGYDNYDIKCTANTDATVTIGKTHYITYNELDIPASYSPIKGITNTNIGQLYFKTGYIPKWDDRVVCYASIMTNYYTYPCYVFGSRNAVNNKSFVFYAHRNGNYNNMGYDRCCGEKDIRSVINNELLKIDADNNGCLCDFAYTSTKINTQMYTVQPQPDYNPEVTLPSEYTKLSGVYFRESYINTNYKIKADDRVEVITKVDNNTNSSYRVLFGARTSSFSADNYFFFTRFNGSNVPCYGKCGKETRGSSFIYGEVIKVIAEPNKISWYKDDELKGEINVTGTAVDCNYNCWIGCGNNSNGVDSWNYATYYNFKIYDKDDNLVLNYIPAKRISDNAVGFYDTVSNTFITRTSGNYALTPVDINDSIYPNNEYEMYLFNCNQTGSYQYSFYGSIYKCTVYSGEGTIKHNFVPVKRLEDSKIGFFDTVTQTFFLPNNGTPTEAAEPTYKGNVIITNIPSDTTITFAKNDNARKPIYLEEGYENDYERKHIDELEYNYELCNASISDYFYTVKCINNANLICSVEGAVSNYYNVPLVGNNTRFPITYNVDNDQNQIDAIASEGATVEITDRLNLVYENVPDEYIKIAGLYNNNSNTYFQLDYFVKATDSIKIWVNDTTTSYSYWIFGAGDDETNNTCILCNRYDSGNQQYYSRNMRRNSLPRPNNEVVMYDCKPSEITYTNGYDTYTYTLSNTPTDCTKPLHIFGCCMYNSQYHYTSFTGTIYKFVIYDDNGIKYNLIPVKRKVDNVLGFYDTVGDNFYLPISGSVTEAQKPKLKGSAIIRNITTDCDVTFTEHEKITRDIVDNDSLETTYSLEATSISDYWYWINVNNTTNGLLTFTNQTYGSCYVCNIGGDILLPCTYKAGYTYADFIVSEGTLTNNGINLTNIKADKTITVMKNDYHDPKSDTNDDLNIFTDPDFSGYNQYRVVNGTDLMLTNYTYINSQIAAMSNKQIFEFNVGELDILAFDPANIPGDHIKARIVTSDSNLTEVVQNVTIDGKQMYKHTISLRNQIKLENGKVYMFKVRDNTDTGKLIAYAKDTGPLNLVNSNGEYTIEDSNIYFNWNEANKYIVQGNKTIYFELNGIKL